MPAAARKDHPMALRAVLLLCALSCCGGPQGEGASLESTSSPATAEAVMSGSGPAAGSPSEMARTCAVDVVQSLREKDMQRLTALTHPERGVRFTAFGFVREGDVVLRAAEVSAAMTDSTVRDFGLEGESDDHILLPYAKYHAR